MALEALIKVSGDRGQYSLIDRTGTPAAYTAPVQLPWRGSRTGVNYACGANTMVGSAVVQALGDTSRPRRTRSPVGGAASPVSGSSAGHGRRQSGQAVGGHSRCTGKRVDANPYLDLRVDDHPNPIPELRAIVHIYRQTYPEYASRTWPDLEGTGGYSILYP